ncbi:hypothetical protein HGO38_05470 [Rhizobium sp. CG5]|uniref:hypothetical protein n=1 Tax=Rhizobium sp. CG5 TaxID=2726076 RepID=UPI00203482CA|nr:hypothetical protein [Rhizobium sp. CG5]MCM2472924.1 hypothetical protein [Rhizobium sp. CG5]
MTLVSFRSWRLIAVAILALWMPLLASGSDVRAQPVDHGVQPWQAERAINDFVQVFIANQVLTNDYSRVRVKISQVTAVYNKDLGWIYVAIFEGAVVPDKADPDQMQTAYHGILKVSAENDMEVIVNEGQGLMEMTTSSALLQQELPEMLGDWASWGGPPSNPGSQQANQAPPTSPPPPQPGPTGSSSGPSATKSQAEIRANFAAANTAYQTARTQNPPPADINEIFARYQDALNDYNDMNNNPDKYK